MTTTAAATTVPASTTAPASTAAAPPPAPATTVAPPAPAPTPNIPEWAKGFPDDIRGYIESKGFKSPQDVVESYRNAEKLLGVPKDRIVKLPEKEDDPAWNDVHARLGRPEKADGYDVKLPADMPGSEEFAKWAKEQFHSLGLSKKQGETLAAKWNEYQLQQFQEHHKSSIDASHQQMAKLKQEWGAAFEQNVGIVQKFAAAVGLDKNAVEAIEVAIGVDGWAKLATGMVQKFGIKLGEHDFVGPESGNGSRFGVLSPAGARAKKDELLSDGEWVKRYSNGGKKEIAEMTQLETWILGG